MIARAVSFWLAGLEARRIDVEAKAGRGLPKFTVVGLPDRAVQEARERVRSALGSSGFSFPAGGLVVNLAPAKERKEGSGFDLAIALAVLTTAGHLRPPDRLRAGGCGRRAGARRPAAAGARRAGHDGGGRPAGPGRHAGGARERRRGGARRHGRRAGADPSQRGRGRAGRHRAGARAARARARRQRGRASRHGRRARPAAGPAGGRDRGRRRAQPADDRAAGQRQDDAGAPPPRAAACAHPGRGAGDHADRLGGRRAGRRRRACSAGPSGRRTTAPRWRRWSATRGCGPAR